MVGPAAGRRANAGGSILVAIDGEPHTEAAVRRALDLAAVHGLDVTAVHVKDPYLEQFASEIYAQGREEYLAHVERCLASLATEAGARFAAAARESGVSHSVKTLAGDPLEVLVREVESGSYGVVFVGCKPLSGIAAWRSGDLPDRLAAALGEIPVIKVGPGA